jgi:hypothetical protein
MADGSREPQPSESTGLGGLVGQTGGGDTFWRSQGWEGTMRTAYASTILRTKVREMMASHRPTHPYTSNTFFAYPSRACVDTFGTRFIVLIVYTYMAYSSYILTLLSVPYRILNSVHSMHAANGIIVSRGPVF